MDNLQQQIQALIFASEQGIRIEEIIFCLQQTSESDYTEVQILAAIDDIKGRYAQADLAIELVKINNGYQFLTKKPYHQVIGLLQLQRSKKKLSQAALETLAVIAYRQPVTKTEVEQIRGVNCDYTIQKLLEKDLISIAGKATTPGKPVIYQTSPYFADYFGINSFTDLPRMKDLEPAENTIGNQQE
ncbi:SMC-Scp complex subunit ScpB [Mucilaginibacter koreensis]